VPLDGCILGGNGQTKIAAISVEARFAPKSDRSHHSSQVGDTGLAQFFEEGFLNSLPGHWGLSGAADFRAPPAHNFTAKRWVSEFERSHRPISQLVRDLK
jgi:hypothetical protein